jgi:hypothetical protein
MSTSRIQSGAARRRTQKSTDIRLAGAELYLLPVMARVPLKFGAETLTSVTCARVRLNVIDRSGRIAAGWGETPLNVQWTWPGDLSYAERQQAMIAFSINSRRPGSISTPGATRSNWVTASSSKCCLN